MSIYNSIINPYKGFSDISFDMTFEEVRSFLKDNKIKFQIEVYPNNGCVPEVAWTVIRIEGGISIYFALNKMFKIFFDDAYEGKLYNGIHIGMDMDEAKDIDSSLEYNEDEEDYYSESGYWLEDDVETNRVVSMTVFIKELLDEESFFTYEWAR